MKNLWLSLMSRSGTNKPSHSTTKVMLHLTVYFNTAESPNSNFGSKNSETQKNKKMLKSSK